MGAQRTKGRHAESTKSNREGNVGRGVQGPPLATTLTGKVDEKYTEAEQPRGGAPHLYAAAEELDPASAAGYRRSAVNCTRRQVTRRANGS